MLNATAQKLGDSTVLRCQGRIVIGDAYATLRNAVLRQTHTRTLILDLAQVDCVDAGGLGVLLGLREWAYSHAIRFQLMNVMNQVELVLELTKLDRIFEFFSVEDMFQLLHFAAAIAPRSVDRANQRITTDNCNHLVEGQDAPPAAQRNSLLAGTTARAQELAEFQPTCSRHKLAQGLVMRGRLLASNATVPARTFFGTDRSSTDCYFDLDSPRFACAYLKFLEISQNLSKWPIPVRHTFKRAKALKIVPIGEFLMQFALLIYELPEAFAARKSDGTDSYTGAWRAYHKALVESGSYLAGDPLEVPETGTTVRLQEGKRRVQDGPFADTKEQLGGFIIMELPSLDAALDWAARCPTAATGAVEVRPLAPAAKHRIT